MQIVCSLNTMIIKLNQQLIETNASKCCIIFQPKNDNGKYVVNHLPKIILLKMLELTVIFFVFYK